MKRTEIRVGGLGGQGIVLAGQILGRAAAHDGKNVVQTQSYGAEARGSMAKSEVIISDSKIGFPMVRKCDVLVAMSQTAVDTHLKDLKEDGFLIADSSAVERISETKGRVFKVPATETSEKTFGTRMYANIIMLGALTRITKAVTEKAMLKAMKETVAGETLNAEVEAYREGLSLADKSIV